MVKKKIRANVQVTFNSKPWKNDQDAVKLGLFYLILNFLFSKPKDHLVDLVYFDTFRTYP